VRELSSSVPSHLSGTIHPHLRQTPSGRLWPHLFEPIRLLELPEFHSLWWSPPVIEKTASWQ